MQPNNVSEKVTGRTLTTEEQAKFKSTIKVAFKHLATANSESSPDIIVAAIDDTVRKWKSDQKGLMNKLFRRGPKESASELANSLGILWGTQLIDRFHWEWVEVQVGTKKSMAVASPNRALVVYPQEHLRRSLSTDDMDCAILASFKSIYAERLPPASAGDYKDVMLAFRR